MASQIHDLFQRSYVVEAGLVGVDDFPPLRRKASHIQSSGNQFVGERIAGDLAAVLEYNESGGDLSIDSLVVHPDFFRRGLARQLMQTILASSSCRIAYVDTAAANSPALALYRKLGFADVRRWNTADGIDKIRLRRSLS